MIAEEIAETTSETIDTAKEIAELQLKKAKLDAAEGLSKISVKAISLLIKLVLAFNIIFFASIGVAIALGDMLGSEHAGYFIVAALFVVALVIFLIFKKHLVEKPVVRMYIELFFKE